jgi:hypothetical protein
VLRVWVRRMYMPRTLDHATIEGNGSLEMLWHYFAPRREACTHESDTCLKRQ